MVVNYNLEVVYKDWDSLLNYYNRKDVVIKDSQAYNKVEDTDFYSVIIVKKEVVSKKNSKIRDSRICRYIINILIKQPIRYG